MNAPFLRPFWQRILPHGPLFGILLILLFGIPRFVIVLKSNVTGDFSLLSIVFVLMWITPFIFLTRLGRRDIGMRKPTHVLWLLYSVVLGIVACSVVFLIGKVLYDGSISNWFVYIAQSYRVQLGNVSPDDKIIYFLIFSFIGMTFSPIGEELLYRGLIHQSFEHSLSKKKAYLLDSAAFAVTHLAHFGFVYHNQHWQFLFLPAIFWMLLIFLSGILFSYCRHKSGSILGAMFCHAAFNVAMMYVIFYWII